MNQFFLYWVDLTALLLSLGLGILLAVKAVKKSSFSIRPVAAFFLFFGPAAIVVHMSFHLLENIFRAGIAAKEGLFVYNFRFYSLVLMGVVLANLSIELLQKALTKCLHQHSRNNSLFKTMAKIVLVSAPTILFTPIGSLPTLACIISLSALPFIYKKKQLQHSPSLKAPVVDLEVEQTAHY